MALVMCGVFSTAVTAQESPAIPAALLKAAENGSPAPQYAVGAAYEAAGDLVTAETWYRKSASQGYAGAQFRLAELLERGEGLTQNVSEAQEWYSRAAAQGFQPAVERVESLRGPSIEQELEPADSEQSAESVIDPRPETVEAPLDTIPVTADTQPLTSTRNKTPDSAQDLPGTILLIGIVPLILIAAMPYSLVKACHVRGLIVYERRRQLIGYTLIPLLFLMAFSMSIAEVDQTGELVAGGVLLIVVLVFFVHWIAVGRLNPQARGAHKALCWCARLAATGPTLVCVWLIWSAVAGNGKSKDSKRQANTAQQIVAITLIALLFYGWLDFVCYPDVDDYPQLERRLREGFDNPAAA